VPNTAILSFGPRWWFSEKDNKGGVSDEASSIKIKPVIFPVFAGTANPGFNGVKFQRREDLCVGL
jgi:hypothetical protein